jgi:hypothetical protein
VGEVDGATAFARLDEMPPGMRPSWREALRWCADGTVDRLFPEARTASLPAPALALGIEALAARGRLGSPIAAVARGHAEACVRSALARVLGWPGTGTLAAECLPALVGDADAGVRRRARWSAGLRDPAAACEPLLPARPADVDAFDARLLGLLGDGRAAGVLSRWAEEDRLRPAALRALGDMGSEEAIETLLRVLAVPDDAVRLEASTGLERALGPLGGEPGDDPVPADPSAADSAWRDAADRVGKAYACFGLARPWAGEAREEPMWWTWRAAILRPTRTTRPLTREVPEGFWDARESLVARPGE